MREGEYQMIKLSTPAGFIIEQLLQKNDIDLQQGGNVEELQVELKHNNMPDKPIEIITIQIKYVMDGYLLMFNHSKSPEWLG